jgi:hypothetical protein
MKRVICAIIFCAGAVLIGSPRLFAAPAPDDYYAPGTAPDHSAGTPASNAASGGTIAGGFSTEGAADAAGAPVIPFLHPVPKDVRNNEYYMESIRLADLAQKSYDEGDYDASATQAAQAAQAARQSDEYAAKLLKIKRANDSLTAARARLDWADGVNAALRYPSAYKQAVGLWDTAGGKYQADDWDGAAADAESALVLLAPFTDAPRLPGTFTVRDWARTKDCLWNIAAMSWAYNDPKKWDILYEANKDILPRPNQPDLVTPGLVLTIPSIKGEIREDMWIEGVEYPAFESGEEAAPPPPVETVPAEAPQAPADDAGDSSDGASDAGADEPAGGEAAQ